MTNGSTEKQQHNDFPPEYNTAITNSAPDAAPSQTAVLIENEQLRAENEKSVLTEHRRQQEETNIFWRGPEAACGGFIAGVIIILLLLKYL